MQIHFNISALYDAEENPSPAPTLPVNAIETAVGSFVNRRAPDGNTLHVNTCPIAAVATN